MKILDYYFKSPVLIDYLLAIILGFLAHKMVTVGNLVIPENGSIYMMSSDLTTISLTLAGFILTFLTVLITFRDNVTETKERYNPESQPFTLFFASHLYKPTVQHLKNATKALVFLAIVGYFIKLILPLQGLIILYYYNIAGVVIIGLTLWRCLLILSRILDLQK